MIKRVLVCLTTGLILVGVSGIAQAGCEGEDFFTEGPSYRYVTKQGSAFHAIDECIDHETFYTEGMRFSPCVRGGTTQVTPVISSGDFHCEGFSDEELEYRRHLKIIENIVPAAGAGD